MSNAQKKKYCWGAVARRCPMPQTMATEPCSSAEKVKGRRGCRWAGGGGLRRKGAVHRHRITRESRSGRSFQSFPGAMPPLGTHKVSWLPRLAAGCSHGQSQTRAPRRYAVRRDIRCFQGASKARLRQKSGVRGAPVETTSSRKAVSALYRLRGNQQDEECVQTAENSSVLRLSIACGSIQRCAPMHRTHHDPSS